MAIKICFRCHDPIVGPVIKTNVTYHEVTEELLPNTDIDMDIDTHVCMKCTIEILKGKK